MKRLFLTLLLVLMPLQLVWAAAAPYCAHETNAAKSEHLGHHAHEHEGETSAAGNDGAETTPATADTDCASCHLAGSATLPAAASSFVILPQSAVAGDSALAYRSHVPFGPERPDRTRLTAAARHGSGVEFRLHNR